MGMLEAARSCPSGARCPVADSLENRLQMARGNQGLGTRE